MLYFPPISDLLLKSNARTPLYRSVIETGDNLIVKDDSDSRKFNVNHKRVFSESIVCNVGHWWLVRVTLVVDFGGSGGDLQMVFCHSMN